MAPSGATTRSSIVATHIPSPPWRVVLRSAWAENDRIRREGSANLVDAAIAGRRGPLHPGVVRARVSRRRRQVDRRVDAARADRLQPNRARRGTLGAALHGQRPGGRRAALRRVLRSRTPSTSPTSSGWSARAGPRMPGDPGAYISSCSHDDAATAVAAALGRRARLVQRRGRPAPDAPRVLRFPRRGPRRSAAASASALGTPLFGSIGKLLARSQRISNLRFRSSSSWEPRYPSVRDGWPSALAGVDGRTSAA